jgi:hypothetical protein
MYLPNKTASPAQPGHERVVLRTSSQNRMSLNPDFPLGAAGSYVAVCGRSVATEAAIFDALSRAHFCQESLLFTSKVASNLARNLPRNRSTS